MHVAPTPGPVVEVAHREEIRAGGRVVEFAVVVEFTPRHEHNFRVIGDRWTVRRTLDGRDPLTTIYNHAVARSRAEARRMVAEFVADAGFRECIERNLRYSFNPLGREETPPL